MRQITLLFLLAFLWACKKGNKEPDCKFSVITYAGNSIKLAVSYFPGDTVVQVGEGGYGYTLYLNAQKRMLRREAPVSDPFYRSEIGYNSNGQVNELRSVTKLGNSWVYQNRLVFSYNGGRMVNMREEIAASQPGNVYDHQFIWQGNDIVSVEHRLNQVTQCTTHFSYEGAKPNPMRRFSNFYFIDGDANYVYYKLPYYFSEHLVTKQESTCPFPETLLFNYTFTTTGLIESMSNQTPFLTSPMWGYEYECR